MLPPAPPNICDLEISIYYRKREMLKTTVSVARLQLHYHSEAPELEAQHHICFPPTDGLLDHKQVDGGAWTIPPLVFVIFKFCPFVSQVEYTNRILNSVQKGLLLEVRDTGVYAMRQDRCHVFASTSDPRRAHVEPSKLPQNNVVELLSFAKYVQGMFCCWCLWKKKILPLLSAAFAAAERLICAQN